MNGTERTALNCDCLLSQGPQGPQGEHGPQGPQGVPGESGPKGDTGNDGKSAYQQAVEGGYTGTEEEFKEELARLPYQAQEAVSAHNLSPEAHLDIRQAIEALQLLKLVDVLPAQGESKYIYAVPQDERTSDGQLIVVLFIWADGEWAAVGALTTSVDLSDYLKKTEAANTYLPLTGGTITGSLRITSSGESSGYLSANTKLLLTNTKNVNVPLEMLRYANGSYSQSVLWDADKGAAGGVASLGSDGKVPTAQLPDLSNITQVEDLGLVSAAVLQAGKNYALSVSGTASITLTNPADTGAANKITVNLTVLAQTNIDWGVNVNAPLAQFEPGKYQIRLLWNNNSSAWTAEILKEASAESSVKLLVRFNGSLADESASPLTLTPSRIVSAFPVYAEGQYGQQKLTCTGDSPDNYVTASGESLSKLNLGTGDFTIKCWLTLASSINYPVNIFYKDADNQIALGYDRVHIRIGGTLILNQAISGVAAGETAYITLTRQNGTLYFFVNGSLTASQASNENFDLSDWTQIFKGTGVLGAGHYGIQELIVKNTCDYTASFTPPSEAFVLTDSGVSDLHDRKTFELYEELESLRAEIEILRGKIMKRPDYSNAAEFSLYSETASYTCPGDGYLWGNVYQDVTSNGKTYQGRILINGKDLFSNAEKNIPLLILVSTGDIITKTGNWQAFASPFYFIPEKAD